MHRVEINCETGEELIIDLTPEEIAEIEAIEPPPPPPPPLTARQRLEAAGFSIAELRELLLAED
jgi:hypothetical protein